MMAYTWPHARRCAACIMFESESALAQYWNNEYAQLVKSMTPYLVQEATVFDHGIVWKSRSRKEMEDEQNYLRIWSYDVQDGKEQEMEKYWTEALNFDLDDGDWMMYSCTRPTFGRWSFAVSQRIGTVGERYVLDERTNVESGPLSTIVKGPATYDDYWILEGVSYPH